MSQNTDREEQLPFRSVVRKGQPEGEPVASSKRDADILHDQIQDGVDDLDDQWTADAIEEAYQRALEAADIAELQESPPGEESDPRDTEPSGALDLLGFEIGIDVGPATSGSTTTAGSVPTRGDDEQSEAVGGLACDATVPATAQQRTTGSAGDAVSEKRPGSSKVETTAEPAVTLKQIVESLLFVGGDDLTTRRLSEVLGDVAHEYIDEAILQLNQEYAAQRRPYEIRMAEGGYRMVLRYEYEKVRHRVFGIGPREVKLSQESLELLAFIAYRQPVTKEGLEETGKKNAAALVRQLVLRELVKVERATDSGEPTYATTSRFLQLFGLNSILDLPRAEQLELR